MANVSVRIDATRPIFIEADADSFGEVFANMTDADQVEVLRAMVQHMKPHQTQWDHIAIALERTENREIVEVVKGLVPADASELPADVRGFLFAMLGADTWLEAGAIWDANSVHRKAAHDAIARSEGGA